MTDEIYKGCATEGDIAVVAKLAGVEGLKTLRTACQAQHDGRYGYEALMGAKFAFHDMPLHQISSGEKPKPSATPLVPTPDPSSRRR